MAIRSSFRRFLVVRVEGGIPGLAPRPFVELGILFRFTRVVSGWPFPMIFLFSFVELVRGPLAFLEVGMGTV